MSVLPHILLVVILAAYSVLGALIFSYVEGPYESVHKDGLQEAEQRMAGVLWQRLSTTGKPVDEVQFRSLLARELHQYEGELQAAYSAGVKTDSNRRVWTFWGSMYYACTVYTTIGYGNFTPATLLGRLATVIYGVVGIPLFLVLLADVGKLLTRLLKHALSSVADDQFDFGAPVAISIAASYIAAGAVLFSVWEGWNFIDAFYFVFVTLSTVGFGDFVPETSERFVACFLYTLGGLSLLAMVITVLTDTFAATIKRTVDSYLVGTPEPHAKKS